jgi:hypothetical protein
LRDRARSTTDLAKVAHAIDQLTEELHQQPEGGDSNPARAQQAITHYRMCYEQLRRQIERGGTEDALIKQRIGELIELCKRLNPQEGQGNKFS